MKSFFSKAGALFSQHIGNPFLKYARTPVGKITLFNSLLFTLWNVNGLSQKSLVEHFSFQRESSSERIYTALTYAFSHMSALHFGVNMLALHLIGKRIQVSYGNKYVWMLYLAGAAAGSLTMNYFMPYELIPIPKVGADPCISAFISFLATLNPHLTVFNFIVPVKFWFLLLCGIGFVLVSDSSGKNLGGLAVGVGIGLLRRRLIL